VYIDGQRVPQLASDLIVKENSIVRTEKGRAEVRFDRGDIMFLGENSSVRVNHDSNTGSGGLEILTGSAVVVTGSLGPAARCQENVQLSDSGVFRFDVHRVVGENFCKFRVYKGAAAAQMPSFVWVLTTRKMIDLNRSCGDHTPWDEFNARDIDDFDRWSQKRPAAEVRGY
jgi:hypothetical protein